MDKEKFLELNKSYLEIDGFLAKKEQGTKFDFDKKIEKLSNLETDVEDKKEIIQSKIKMLEDTYNSNRERIKKLDEDKIKLQNEIDKLKAINFHKEEREKIDKKLLEEGIEDSTERENKTNEELGKPEKKKEIAQKIFFNKQEQKDTETKINEIIVEMTHLNNYNVELLDLRKMLTEILAIISIATDVNVLNAERIEELKEIKTEFNKLEEENKLYNKLYENLTNLQVKVEE